MGTYTVEKIVIRKGQLRLVYNLLQADIKYSFHIDAPPVYLRPFIWQSQLNGQCVAVLLAAVMRRVLTMNDDAQATSAL
jgi:hypothetical protein